MFHIIFKTFLKIQIFVCILLFAEALVHSVVNKEHVYVNGNYNMDTMQMSCLLDFREVKY